MKSYGDIDSKFRFVILASKRAKQLLKGEKPKVKSKSKNLIRVAEEEVKQGLVEYERIQSEKEEEKTPKTEESSEEKTQGVKNQQKEGSSGEEKEKKKAES